MTSITEQGRAFYDAVPHEVPDWEGSLFSLLEDAARLYPDRAADPCVQLSEFVLPW